MKKLILITCFLFLFIHYSAQAQSGQLWGMTTVGGADNGGVIFKINVGGTNYDTVFSFNPLSGGDSPDGDLYLAVDGKFYGTTFYGGTNSYGSIFSFDPKTKIYTDLHDFDSASGIQSSGSLIVASNGSFYGMTGTGGAHNFGVIFRFNSDSVTYQDVHDFDSIGGSYPYGTLFLSSNNILYGLAEEGGSTNNGVLFSFNPVNNAFNVLNEFNGANGSLPYGSLTQLGNKLYGLAPYGGLNGVGALFSYDIASNAFNKLFDFNSDSGYAPEGTLTHYENGVFYGTTYSGGTNNDGVIFSFDTLTSVFHDEFNFNGADGQSPPASLVLASDGNLYGITELGGADSVGVIFSFNPNNNSCIDEYNFSNNSGDRPNGDLIEVNTSSIEQLTINNYQLSIYPNPAWQLLTIISNQPGVKEIRIENIIGQTLLNYAISNISTQLHETLDVSTFPAGMYFVSLVSGNLTTTAKVIIANK